MRFLKGCASIEASSWSAPRDAAMTEGSCGADVGMSCHLLLPWLDKSARNEAGSARCGKTGVPCRKASA